MDAMTLQLGMLDPMDAQPYVKEIGPANVDSPHSRSIALRAARESIVLLKNDAGLLPLANESLVYDNRVARPGTPLLAPTSVAFIGPHANSTQRLLSNYHGFVRALARVIPLCFTLPELAMRLSFATLHRFALLTCTVKTNL